MRNSLTRLLSTEAVGDLEVIDLWLSTKRSERTRQEYRADVAIFLSGLMPRGIQQATLEDVIRFRDRLTGLCSPATVNRRLSAVKSLLSFCRDTGYTRFNVASPVPSIPVNKSLAERYLTQKQIEKIFRWCHGRDGVLLKSLYYTGARISELLALRRRNVSLREDGLGQVVLFGKGGKTRVVVVPREIYDEMLEVAQDTEDGFVFCGQSGNPLTINYAERAVRKIAEKAGINGVTPHWLRHAHASHAIDRGAPLSVLRDSLGHSDISVTGKYIHSRPEDSSGLYLMRPRRKKNVDSDTPTNGDVRSDGQAEENRPTLCDSGN